jgi:hypothetical protein
MFDLAREDRGWVLVERFYTRATASQLASDISRLHLRTDHVRRVRGIRDGEQWEAAWGRTADAPEGDHRVWIRLVDDNAPSPTGDAPSAQRRRLPPGISPVD